MAEELFTLPLSVLVVEDQEDTAMSTAELLLLHGHAVRIARCGADALQLAATATPDVVLLDLKLPDMDGWAVAERLRAQAVGKQPLVVAVTGCGAAADLRHSAAAGIDLHLVKPVEPAALLRLLGWVCENLATRGALAEARS